MEFYIGQIFMGGWNFNPRGSVFCSGQLMPIASNSALFSLLGTTYGGDGRTTYGIPDLRGRIAMQQGQGPGLSNIQLGQKGGNEYTTLTTGNLPAHHHNMNVGQTGRGSGYGADPTNNYPAPLDSSVSGWSSQSSGTFTAASSNTGSNQAFSNRSPFLGISFCLATTGIYPSRN